MKKDYSLKILCKMRYKIVALIISPPTALSVIRSYPKNVHDTGSIAKQPRLKNIAKTKKSRAS